MEVEGSRFQGSAAVVKQKLNKTENVLPDAMESPDFDDGLSSSAFYAVEFSTDDDNANGTATNEENVEVPNPKKSVEDKKTEEMEVVTGSVVDGEKKSTTSKETDILKIKEKEATAAALSSSINGTDKPKMGLIGEEEEKGIFFQADD